MRPFEFIAVCDVAKYGHVRFTQLVNVALRQNIIANDGSCLFGVWSNWRTARSWFESNSWLWGAAIRITPFLIRTVVAKLNKPISYDPVRIGLPMIVQKDISLNWLVGLNLAELSKSPHWRTNIKISALCHFKRMFGVLIGNEHRAPLEGGERGIGEDNQHSDNAKSKIPPLKAGELAVAGCVLVYKGLENVYLGPRDWPGIVLTQIGGILWCFGLAKFLCCLVA